MESKFKCLACVGEYIQYNADKNGKNGVAPVIEDAITLAPSWQTTQMGGQQLIACVAVPTCYQHLNVNEKSPMEKAMMGGIILPGQVGLCQLSLEKSSHRGFLMQA